MDNRYGLGLLSVLLLAAAIGCAHDEPRVHYLGDSDLEYYKEEATRVDYPLIQEQLPDAVLVSDAPRTLTAPRKDQIWDMPLMEAIQIALANNPVVRTAPAQSVLGNSLFNNPDGITTVFDPAIQETGVLFGGRGVEAALAAFDPTLTGQMIWGRNEQIQNSLFFGGFNNGAAGLGGVNGFPVSVGSGRELVTETGNFQAGLQKIFANGGQVTLTHSWLYTGTNAPSVLFPSSYVGLAQLGYRQPLLAGAGTEFTRIAGPIANAFGGLTGVNQGVVIARINNDIQIAEFEISVRNLTREVERLYWELYLQYRLYDVAVTARNSALGIWQTRRTVIELGGRRGATDDIAQETIARTQYFQAQEQVATTLSLLYTSETRLRQLLGLPVNDGKIIRPADEPPVAQIVPDWHASLAEALTNRVELRRQKFNVKSLELQLQAAQNLVRPRLDFVGNYNVNAFGDRLFGDQDDDGVTQQGLRSAYETLTQGNQTGWGLGFQFNMPIGLRSARTQVRNIELRLAKARSVLATQEQGVAQELAVTIQDLARYHRSAELNFNRRAAAVERVQVLEDRAEIERIEFRLQAIQARALAEQEYYTSLANYARTIADYHFAKGNLLEYNNVYLAEGGWHPAAYAQALRRAWHRSYGFEHNLTDAEPDVFVTPENQHDGEYAPAHAPLPPVLPHHAAEPLPPGAELAPMPSPEPEPKSDYEPDDEPQPLRSPDGGPMTGGPMTGGPMTGGPMTGGQGTGGLIIDGWASESAGRRQPTLSGAAGASGAVTGSTGRRLELPRLPGPEPAGVDESLELVPGRDYLE